MKDKAFLDTNVLLYLYSIDEPSKRKLAFEAINHYYCITSLQAINEFNNVLVKKWKFPLAQIIAAIEEIHTCCVFINVDLPIIVRALTICNRYHFSYYDSIMISSALSAECKVILSEDMQPDMLIENKLTIINIFK